MTIQRERYDRIAEGYARWWAPIHAPATVALLDVVEQDVAAGATRLLDVGTGTGTLARAALERWPSVAVTGVDASDGMLAVAEREARVTLPPARRRALELRQAYADRLPFDDASFDIVLSAFVYQLVPSRARALREAHRVLRPGGRLAYVTWLEAGDEGFLGDVAFDEALVGVGLEERGPAGDGGDVRSPAAAAAQLRRAGLVDVSARARRFEHRFTPEEFLGFLARFDEEDLFGSLEPTVRTRLEAETLRRLEALPQAALSMGLPVVYAAGRRPPG